MHMRSLELRGFTPENASCYGSLSVVRFAVPPLLALLILASVSPSPAAVEGAYDVEEDRPLTLRGLADTRVVQGGRAPAWTDRGPGKTRFGGDEDFDRRTRVVLAQLALELGGVLPWGIVPRAQLDVESGADVEWRPLLVEAHLRREWGRYERGAGVQVGLMTPPFSLEHAGPAWTPAYTLTPSALGSWVWEELRTTGGELEAWRRLPGGWRADVVGGAGFGADEAGTLLAERGWVLSDYLGGVNATLPLPAAGKSTAVFSERDGRPALYLWATVTDPTQHAALHFGYFDNLGAVGEDGVWATRFGTVGAVLHPLPHVDVLVQWLEGGTRTRQNDWESRFRAFYPLVSLHWRGHRLSARYDLFEVHDRDGPPDSQERGDAGTFAYLFEFWLRHRIGVEYVLVRSHRDAPFRGEPSDDGWQVSYRFRY
jgi:hypothetical protein